jgi:carboxypeptidase family protein
LAGEVDMARVRKLIVGVVLALCSLCAAQETKSVAGRGILAGAVVDQFGAPISGALVFVENEKSSRTQVVRVNGFGRFDFSLAPGCYYVQVRASGFVAARAHLVIARGDTVQFEPNLGADNEHMEQ